jgi:hypothetical protein
VRRAQFLALPNSGWLMFFAPQVDAFETKSRKIGLRSHHLMRQNRLEQSKKSVSPNDEHDSPGRASGFSISSCKLGSCYGGWESCLRWLVMLRNESRAEHVRLLVESGQTVRYRANGGRLQRLQRLLKGLFKARIWPRLSYMCHNRSTAASQTNMLVESQDSCQWFVHRDGC